MLLALCCARTTATAQDAVLVLSPAPVLTTIAGAGQASPLASPSAVAYDANGNLYVCDTRNHRVRRVSATGAITTVAGNGTQGFGGDNGPAVAASLDSPLGVAVATDNTLYIADTRNHRIRRVTTDGTIQTIAGTGIPGFSGDLGQAANAQFRSPSAVAIGAVGELYVADTGNHRIRRIALDGTVQTVAGSGREEASGDGGTATSAGLDAPGSLAFRTSDGALLIADRLNSRIRVLAQNGIISSLPTAAAPVRRPAGVATDSTGAIYIADTGNYRLRAVMPQGSGVLLGSGEQGAPDPALAYNATPLGTPLGIAPDTAGGVAFTDRDHNQVEHLALPQLAFAATVVGQASPPQTLLLQNSGDSTLAVQSVTLPAAFQSQPSGTCGTAPFTLAGNAQCTVALAFVPTSVGAQSGILTVALTGLPQRAVLSGTGVTTGTLLPTSTTLQTSGNLSFVGTPVVFTAAVLASGTAPATGTVHWIDAATEIGSASLDAGGTAVLTTAALAIGQHSLSARYDGDVHYSASTSAALQQTVAPAPDFTLTPAATQMSATAGSTASLDFVLQPINGTLNRTVTLAFDGLPAGATATSNAPTPLVLGSNAVTLTLSVKTAAPAALPVRLALVLPGAGLLWLLLRRARNRAPWTRSLLATVLLASLALLAGGCGGGYLGSAAVAAQSVTHTYPLTITATTTGVSGTALVHTASITLVVN